MVTIGAVDRMDLLLLIVEKTDEETPAMERWGVSQIGWTMPVCHGAFWMKAWLCFGSLWMVF